MKQEQVKTGRIGWLMVGLLVVGSALYPFLTHAMVWRAGDTVSIAEDQVVLGDFYSVGSDVHLSGHVDGDVYVVGGTVTLNGPISGDVVVLGGTVIVNGPVEDDVRVLGGKVVVGGQVGGDVVVVGGSLAVLSSAHVGGEAFFYGVTAEVGGVIKGALRVNADTLVVSGSAGSLDAHASQGVSLRDGAHILGTVSYESPRSLDRAPSAVVDGELTQRASERVSLGTILGSYLPLWFMALFASLVSVLLLRDFLATLLKTETRSLGLRGLSGLGVLCVTPIVATLLIVVWPGLLLGVLLFVVYVAILVVAFIIAHVYVGALLAKLIIKEYKVTWFWTALGVGLFEGVIRIPIVGFLVAVVVMALVSGMLAHHAYLRIRGH